MTILVASLFLPFSVEFHLKEDAANPDLINAINLQTKLRTNSSSSPVNQTQITGKKHPSSILSRALSSEEVKTTNSSIEDFFYQSQSRAETSSTASSLNFNEEPGLIHSNFQSSSGFVPKSRVANLNKRHQKSNLNLQLNEGLDSLLVSDDELGLADDDEEDVDNVGDDDNKDKVLANYNKIPEFGGFSKKNVLSSKCAKDVYNNSTYNIINYEKGNGALMKAVKSSLKPNTYKWVGTIGIPTDDLPRDIRKSITQTLSRDFNCESVLPSDITFQGHYKNYCKQILWPTLHYQIPDDPNSKAFEDHSWEFYKQLNQEFADRIIEAYVPGDLIWVHDYHLFLVPEMIRSKLPNAKIGFYLHVSFPSSEVFKCLAQRESILRGILGSNYASFQTDEYVRHFSQTCNKLLLADISKGEIRFKGFRVKISSSPVGIDSDELSNTIDYSSEVSEWRNLIREKWPSEKLIVGRDKFDKIRGVKQKLLAYELFLKSNPEYIETTVLIQICLRSKTDANSKLESEIMSIVDRINSLSPNISENTQPVVFLHQDIEFFQYLGLLAEADCFIVSSMREGMNLTCHEFIVATKEKKSPLILSEFTGSASVFKKGPLKINPWDIKEVSLQIKRALNLTELERLSNWKDSYEVVQLQDCHNWVNQNLNNIELSWIFQLEKNRQHNLNVDHFKQKLKDSKSKLLIFNIETIPSKRILKILSDLLETGSYIYIFSDYKRLELERLYRSLLPKIGLIAENGGLIKLAGETQWSSLIDWKAIKSSLLIFKDVLKSYEERIPESYIENGETFIKFHTEANVQDPERKNLLVGDLITHINENEQSDDKNMALEIHATISDGIVYVQHTSIATMAIDFLINVYIDVTSKNHLTEKVSKFNLSSNSLISSDYISQVEPVDFLVIGGRSNFIFDPVFEYANEFLKEKTSTIGFTIGYREDEDSTSMATERVDGLNELFTIFTNF